MISIDKENDVNFSNRVPSTKSFGDNSKVSKPRFASMLQNVRQEIQSETDNLVAIDAQADEVAGIVQEWIQENQDFEKAKELQEALKEEEIANKRLEILRGESEALRVAVEEKRRLKAEAEAKMQREDTDAAFAKRLFDEEEIALEKARQAKMALEEEDYKLCRQLSDRDGAKGAREEEEEEKSPEFLNSPSIAEAKLRPRHLPQNHNINFQSPQDFKFTQGSRKSPPQHIILDYVSESDTDSDSEEDAFDDDEKACDDEKDGASPEDQLHFATQRIQQLESDFEIARFFQRQLDLESQQTREEREAKDSQYSKQLMMLEERRAFMARKRSALKEFYEFTSKAPEIVGNLWETCEAEVDNVSNTSLCLTLLLPDVKQLDVSLVHEKVEMSKAKKAGLMVKMMTFGRRGTKHMKKNPIIRINAQRLVGSMKKATPENSFYAAEFQLDPQQANGAKSDHMLQISQKDIYFEYSSESGLLFIFIENILLNESLYVPPAQTTSSRALAAYSDDAQDENAAPSNRAPSSAPSSAPSQSNDGRLTKAASERSMQTGSSKSVKGKIISDFQRGFMRVFGHGSSGAESKSSSASMRENKQGDAGNKL